MTKPARGQVWRIRFDPAVGSEMKKVRPAVIMTEEGLGTLPLQIVVPITAWEPKYIHYPWMVHLRPNKANGLEKESAADAFQVKSLSNKRLVECIGILESSKVKDIAAAIASCGGDV